MGDVVEEFIITIQLEKWNTTERTLNRAHRCILKKCISAVFIFI